MKKLFLSLSFIVVVGALGIWWRQAGNNVLVTSSIEKTITPSPTATPTPTPPVFNQDSNLEKELENSVIEDFSLDFQELREEAGN